MTSGESGAITGSSGPVKVLDKARDMETHRLDRHSTVTSSRTNRKSLRRYRQPTVGRQCIRLGEQHELKLKPRGNGPVITDGRHHAKASSLDRKISMGTLKPHLGEVCSC